MGDMCVYYLRDMFSKTRRKKALATARRVLKEKDFDTLVCRGVSGMAITPTIADRMGKNFAVVRKGEETHSGLAVEGPDEVGKYVVIDDCIDSGKSVVDMIEKITSHYSGSKCVGVYLYEQRPSKLNPGWTQDQLRNYESITYPPPVWCHGAK